MLDESVVTTASATSERDSVAPATSVTITSEELRMFGVRSLAEAMSFLSLGVVASDPLRTPDLGARGVLLNSDDGNCSSLVVCFVSLADHIFGICDHDDGVETGRRGPPDLQVLELTGR